MGQGVCVCVFMCVNLSLWPLLMASSWPFLLWQIYLCPRKANICARTHTHTHTLSLCQSQHNTVCFVSLKNRLLIVRGWFFILLHLSVHSSSLLLSPSLSSPLPSLLLSSFLLL